MKTDDFDYALPDELIAQQPPAQRTAARMMVVHRREGTLAHRQVSDIGDYLQRGDVLVVNNTKVIPARLYGQKAATGGAVELLLLEPLGEDEWLALCRASNQPKPGMRLQLAQGRIQADVVSQEKEGRLRLKLMLEGSLYAALDQVGEIPLPPYIKRQDGASSQDAERYQTVYATQPGAVAAPTAGLHFTSALLAQLADAGVSKAELTLHVGIGTFRPVSVEDVTQHKMDEERYEIQPESAVRIAAARAVGGRVVAVGSTSVRTLETMMRDRGEITACRGRSDIFIYPPFQFRAVDAMLTNFHLPKSTLLMMVSALAGIDLIRDAYQEAIHERYRFFSYGDCMLIL